jgi:hypothetical protein
MERATANGRTRCRHSGAVPATTTLGHPEPLFTSPSPVVPLTAPRDLRTVRLVRGREALPRPTVKGEEDGS